MTAAVVEPTLIDREPRWDVTPWGGRYWRCSVDNYHALIKHGILDENNSVELLEGLLAVPMSKNPPHRVVKRLLMRILEDLVTTGWFVEDQEPVTTADSEPEPDVVILRGDPRDYTENHPGPGDTALVVEIAESSLAIDRGIKKRIYARAGIGQYWIVNLLDRVIEVYTEPLGTAETADYAQRRDYGETERIAVRLHGVAIGSFVVRDVLP